MNEREHTDGPTRERVRRASRVRVHLGALLLFVLMTGCTTFQQYKDNGCLVGPNYARPPAAVAQKWIDAADPRVRPDPLEPRDWWVVFKDPVLDDLICAAYQQNLELRQASFRVLEQQAILGIAIGRFFPQLQTADGSYQRVALSKAVANREFIPDRFYDNWFQGLALVWELDLWGKYRRSIEAAQANVDAAIEDYDHILVQVLGAVARDYAHYRILEREIELVKTNVKLQEETLTIAKARFKGGLVSELDVDQAESILAQTKATIPELETRQRIFQNALCVLLGIPAEDLACKLRKGAIPTAPASVILGVPCDLIRRRPDVRRQERLAAAQCPLIGVAESEFYPSVSITGQIGYQAKNFPDLFSPDALQGLIGPAFQWKILNYGRIANNVLRAEASFQQAVVSYQQSVLKANEEVENGVVRFLKAQERTRELTKSVEAAEKAVVIAVAQYKAGRIDFNRVSVIEQNLVQQQDLQAQATGEIALGLIAVFKALGGGWQIRLDGCKPSGSPLLGGAVTTDPKSDAKKSDDKLDKLPVPRPLESDEADDANRAPAPKQDDGKTRARDPNKIAGT